MFKNLQLKETPDRIEPNPDELTSEWLEMDSQSPIMLSQINNLPENIKKRVCRNLIPPELLVRFQIDPVSWKGADRSLHVRLESEPGTGSIQLWAYSDGEQRDDFFHLNISDNSRSSIDIVMLHLNNPESPRFWNRFPSGWIFRIFRRNRSEFG